MNNNAIISTVGLTKVYLDFWRRARVNAVSDLDLEILFLALDRAEDARRLYSLELTGAWLDEARERRD